MVEGEIGDVALGLLNILEALNDALHENNLEGFKRLEAKRIRMEHKLRKMINEKKRRKKRPRVRTERLYDPYQQMRRR